VIPKQQGSLLLKSADFNKNKREHEPSYAPRYCNVLHTWSVGGETLMTFEN